LVIPLPESYGGKVETDEAALQGDYFDFAIRYRLDYLPFFTEGNVPAESAEYLYYAFAINLDNWGDDKGTMTREYVEKVIHSHFEVGEINHAPLNIHFDKQNKVKSVDLVFEEG